MTTFNKWNNIQGWLIFAVSLIIYVLTLEPTMSLWDCGEFIVSASKLEISHAPGAPLFVMLGRIFSLFSTGHTEKAAMMINLISAISSAATVMLLFWISVWLMKKTVNIKPALIWMASATGALSFAFSDSFWFSAVEAEVYALSSLFTALVLWAVTKWEREPETKYSNRWIVLIFFMTGLSIGVHLLNLLVIPTVALIIYIRRYPVTVKGTIFVMTGSMLLILVIMNVYIPGLFELAGPLELLAVNTLGLPVNTGFYLYLVLLSAAFILALYFTQKKGKTLWNTVVLCFLFLTLGYTSYLSVFIRSEANPPVDQGNPETTFELINYLKRESYGTRPIFYGENFGSVPREYKERNSYEFDGKKYVPARLNPKVVYYSQTTGFFPRMYSREDGQAGAYRQWSGWKGRKVQFETENGITETTTVPTFGENLRFFLNYQLGHMYIRYFLWNFAGRQNDIQGTGGPLYGNWICGIPVIDSLRLGPQKNLPDELQNNEARNRYFFLPLILGLAGMIYHYRHEKKTFYPVLLLFLIMSIGLVAYLNEIPETPRERDYVYVGSFFIFSIWIGFGALALFNFVMKKTKHRFFVLTATLIAFLAGPGILLQQNYNDHNRSGRYSGRDLAKNYLMSCEPNAILFTHGDNDTYPVWYCQEVEGIRKDIRIVVMPYLSAGWYIRQINREIYDNPGLKLTIPVEKYEAGNIDYIPVVSRIKKEQVINDVLKFVASDSSGTKIRMQDGDILDYIPVTNLKISVNNDSIPIKLKESYMMKGDLAFWDVIASNIGKRPICFTSLADPADHGLQDYLRFDGMVYTLVPEKYESGNIAGTGETDSKILYDNLMKRCNWTNLKDSSVYFSWHHRRMFAVAQIRQAFYRLADVLAKEEKDDLAARVIREGESVQPLRLWPVDYWSCQLNEAWFKIGRNSEGLSQLKKQTANLEQWLDYFSLFRGNEAMFINQEETSKLYLYHYLLKLAEQYAPELAEKMRVRLESYLRTMT